MSRTVITEDDLAPQPLPSTGEHATVPPPPAAAAGGVREQLRRFAPALVGLGAVGLLAGAFFLGQSTRSSDAAIDDEVRDAIREVREGMRKDRIAITNRALARQRSELRAQHRRQLAALRKKYGLPDPTPAKPKASSSTPRAATAPSPAPTPAPAPAPPVAPTPSPSPEPSPPSAGPMPTPPNPPSNTLDLE